MCFLASQILKKLITWPKKTCFWIGIICIHVSVCLCLCDSLPRLSQKVLDRFRSNLAGWFITVKGRFFFIMKRTTFVERSILKVISYKVIKYTFMKLCRMMYNVKRQIHPNDKWNRLKRTHISPNWNVKIAIFIKVIGDNSLKLHIIAFFSLSRLFWTWEESLW